MFGMRVSMSSYSFSLAVSHRTPRMSIDGVELNFTWAV